MDRGLDGKHVGMMLTVVFLATFMDGLDGSIVNVALPSIGKDFGMDTATVSWVAITYMMILAGTLVAFARISSNIGVRKIMAIGLTVFTVSSLFCGISPTFPVLIASRALQAVGAAMMAAAGPMCCTKHLPPHRLAFGLSIVTIGASLGFALGPAVGGAILEFATWHWIFLINIPFGLVSVPLMLAAIPEKKGERGTAKPDVTGTVLLFAAIVTVTFAVETLSRPAFRTYAVIAAVAGIVSLFAFVKTEKTVLNPLLKLSMFRRWDFTAIFLCLMFINMIFMCLLYLIPFFGEVYMNESSFVIGMVLLISAAITAVFGMPAAKLSDRTGRRIFCVMSGVFIAVGLLMFVFLSDGMSLAVLVAVMVPMGLSWACVGGPMASRLVEHAGDERDMASSLTNEAYYVGGAIGTALGALSFTVFSGTGGIDIKDVAPSAFLDGFVPTAAILLVFAAAIAVLSFAVKDD